MSHLDYAAKNEVLVALRVVFNEARQDETSIHTFVRSAGRTKRERVEIALREVEALPSVIRGGE